jgi:Tfp pilus assembly protein PilP
MKARTIAPMLLLTAVTVWAQTAPPSQKVAPAPSPFGKPAVKAVTQAPAKPVQPAVSKAAKPVQPAVSKAAKPATPAVSKAAKPAAKPAKAAAAKTPEVTSASASAKPKGKRDPFVNPIVRADGTSSTCSTGKKCLAIDGIVLKGIVKSQVGMIAVVESSARRLSYFLRENDPVFNGYVVKITRDSVVFRENVMDALGRQSTREVVKKVVAPVV